MKRFALIGAAGFVAPRHMKAVRDTGNNLVAALDPSDSVGIIDSYFPDAKFFTEFERFDRHIDMLRRSGNGVDFISIASPNYLHDSHMRFALRAGANAICEKPVVLNPWNIDGLKQIEQDTGRTINTILQLRLHPAIIALREKVAAFPDRKFDVDLTYITSRGNWYQQSWKGEDKKAGGIATNIGVHFFDMLQFVFGGFQESCVHVSDPDKASGFLELERARVRWFLSIDVNDIPETERASGKRTYRVISVDSEELEFSDGFADLHTRSYEQVLAGRGFGLEDNVATIALVAGIRNAPIVSAGEVHPFARRSTP